MNIRYIFLLLLTTAQSTPSPTKAPFTAIDGFGNTDLLECEGDCDYDTQCIGDLKCYQRIRDYDPKPPGCEGYYMYKSWDYCYNPIYGGNITFVHAAGTNLGVCEGDCDSDSDCIGDLKCYQRDLIDDPNPPRCTGQATGLWDYCYNPYNEDITWIGVNPTNLLECEGDCDDDTDCIGDFTCYQREKIDPTPPGCKGTPISLWDYCYNSAMNSIPDGSVWQILLLSHKNVSNGYFDSAMASTGIENFFDPTANTHSIIGNITDNELLKYKDNNGFYSFILYYTTLSNENIRIEWKQTSWITEPTITGYIPIDIPPEQTALGDSKFRGLHKSTMAGYSYLDGNDESAGVWNSVGSLAMMQYAWDGGGIPCFDDNACKSAELNLIIPKFSSTLLLSHKDVGNGYFATSISSAGTENVGDPNANTYSNIGSIETYELKYKDINGFYRFTLDYITLSDVSIHIEWKQMSWITESTIIGYTAIDVPPQAKPDGIFVGLGKADLEHNDNEYLDGTHNWWNAVGAIVPYELGFRCHNGNNCKAAELNVIIPHLLFNIQC